MRIVVTDLTRMEVGYMCVVGVEVGSGRRVRPVSGRGRLSIRHLACHGGTFDVAALVDLGGMTHRSTPPEREDHEFDPWRARALRTLDPQDFWKLLARGA